MIKVLIGMFAFTAVSLFIWSGTRVFQTVAQEYKEQFTETASKNLTDLFLFIEPQVLFRLNIIAIICGFLFFWWFFGSWVPALVIAVILLFIPKKVYEILKKRRRELFVSQLPDTLITLSTSMRAGSSLVSALENLVSEAPAPTNQEFGLFLRELRIGGEFGETLDKMVDRLEESEVELVVAGMKISKEVGGNLADMLERLSDTLRRKLEMEGKIKALTSQGKAQGIVMSLLPSLIVFALYHIEPEAMSRLFSDPAGWVVIAIALVMQFIGYKFIKKIVTIDV